MNDEKELVLVLSDISGYTEFLRLHAMATSHAAQIMQKLLGCLVESTATPFKVAELEGDAVFIYAVVEPEHLCAFSEKVLNQLATYFKVFETEREALNCLQSCPCEACKQIGKLQLKQVVHWGRVSFQKIAEHRKLFGLDVVLIHRILKNSIAEKRYLLLTETAFQNLKLNDALPAIKGSEEIKEIGSVDTRFFAGEDLDRYLVKYSPPPSHSTRSGLRALLWKIGMQLKTFFSGYKR